MPTLNTRRSVLRKSGLALTVALTGCMGNDSGSPNGTTSLTERQENSEEKPTECKNTVEKTVPDYSVPDIEIGNYIDRDHSILLTVEKDGKEVLKEEYTVEAGEGKRISNVFENEGEYSIEAIRDDGVESSSSFSVSEKDLRENRTGVGIIIRGNRLEIVGVHADTPPAPTSSVDC